MRKQLTDLERNQENITTQSTVQLLRKKILLAESCMNKFCLLNSADYDRDEDSMVNPMILQKYQMFPENPVVSYHALVNEERTNPCNWVFWRAPHDMNKDALPLNVRPIGNNRASAT